MAKNFLNLSHLILSISLFALSRLLIHWTTRGLQLRAQILLLHNLNHELFRPEGGAGSHPKGIDQLINGGFFRKLERVRRKTGRGGRKRTGRGLRNGVRDGSGVRKEGGRLRG